MQDSLFHAVQIDETTRSSFAAFQQNPLERFKWNVRRTRAAQLRELLSNPDAINLQTFLREVWSIESETCLRSRDRELRIFESTVLAQSIEQLLSENTVTLEELEKALDSGDLEFHGNYIWRQGSKGYDIRPSKTDQQRLEQIHQALSILNRPDLPLNKAVQIEAIPGFDEENATGLVMIFHPNEFALVNAVSRGILKRLGVNHTASTPQQVIQNELRYLKKALGATDFLELDWFLYQCIQDEYPLVAVESAIGGRANGTCLQAIIKVLEEAGEPLHYKEIDTRAQATGIQTSGKTPKNTVNSCLTTNTTIFEKVGSGVYRLKQNRSPLSSPQKKLYIEPPFEQIKQTILAQELRIDERTLRRYHLALKTRGFVILSGISGIGKTWLAEAYASAIDAKYCLVPVAPNWTTNEDLLGYINPLNKVQYHHTTFSFFLELAAQEYDLARNEGRLALPFHLILDEMNLARVEYYFSQFLSAMEVRARYKSARIALGAQKFINLYPNLFFIGTINVDETTHGFADKIYDRAQLIELSLSRQALQEHIGDASYSDLLMGVWEAIHDVAPFAFRVVDEIRVYVDASVQLGYKWEESLDEQIVQKILPKCKGADLRIGSALRKLEGILPADTYPLSVAKIQHMIEGFDHHGFTSYF